jgi:hypothetical protein
MNRLLEIGFVPAGHWLLEDDRLRCELTRHSTQKNILYAFVCDGQVKYVGKTIRALWVRMSGYRTPGKTQTTNINNHRHIKESLSRGAAVEILALPDSGLLHYGQFHLNLAAALEDAIIRIMDPEWNGGTAEGEAHLPELPATVPESSPPIVGMFPFSLQPTYYRTGFFNVGVSSANVLGADGETIELFLGEGDQPILGTINRRANMNGSPRIMGGSGLRDWFKTNASEMESISVEVLSPTAIRLRATEA